MPIPQPTNAETKEEFIVRCMSDDKMKTEYNDPQQRYAVCSTQWTESK